ncbi:MAG: glycosyl hydrolase family 28 protein [Candidatus Hydrogenedentales bacterium]|jgi:hypothetical protein
MPPHPYSHVRSGLAAGCVLIALTVLAGCVRIASTTRVNVVGHPVVALDGVVGDGENDDTDGIQKALDSGASIVYLPPPARHYRISRALSIHSGQTLQMDAATTIRLADGANSHMIENADRRGGDKGISVIGGIWDGNNAGQTPHDFSPNVSFDHNRYIGVMLRFDNVQDLRLNGLTLKDPESFAVQLANLDRFDVRDIVFDYNMLRPNMDGIHLNGNCRFGTITNLKGATNDDMVALNADDGGIAEMARGPIRDVRIDGLYAENGYTAVRLLSAGSPVSQVHISNLFGTFRYNVLSFTHHNVHPGTPSRFDDIVIDNVFCSKPTEALANPLPSDDWGRTSSPLIWIASGVEVGSLTVRDLHRTERFDGAPDTIVVENDAAVEFLVVSDSSVHNQTTKPIAMLRNNGEITNLSMTKVRMSGRQGEPPDRVVDGGGVSAGKHLDCIYP